MYILKRHFIIYFSFAFFLAVITSGCVSAEQKQTDDADTSTRNNTEVVLVTGPPDKEVVWHITGITRTKNYVTRDFKAVQSGDGALIQGFCTFGLGNTPFTGDPKEEANTVFVVEDLLGQRYDTLGSSRGESDAGNESKDEFKLQAGLAGEGMHNSAIKSWNDLIVIDPNEKTQGLPGHKVSLGIFDP